MFLEIFVLVVKLQYTSLYEIYVSSNSGPWSVGEQTAQEAMTPIESTFCLDVDSKLDW